MRLKAFIISVVAATLYPAIVAGALAGSPYATVIKGALIRDRLNAKTVCDLKAADVSGVEMSLMMKTLPTLEEARAARALAESEGIEITSTIGGWFAFNEPEKYDAALERAKQCIELTAAYGATVMLIVPVGSYPSDGPRLPPYCEFSYSWNVHGDSPHGPAERFEFFEQLPYSPGRRRHCHLAADVGGRQPLNRVCAIPDRIAKLLDISWNPLRRREYRVK